MLRMALLTFHERWTLFIGTTLSVALGVALVEASTLILDAASAVDGSRAERRLAADVESFIGLTLVVSVGLSVFIIGSTFTFAVTERRRDLALLRLTGATGRQLRLLLVGESVLVGLVGSLLGVLVGPILAAAQLLTLRRLGMDTDLLDVQLSRASVLFGLASGLTVSVLGVWLASRRAARVRPLEALRDGGSAARVMTLGRWIWGLAAAGGTAAAVLVTRVSGDPVAGIALSILVIFSAAIALQQLSPLLVPLVGRTAGVLARRWPEGEIAHANLVDGRRRAATVAGPLIAMVGIVIGMYGVVLTQSAATVRDRELSTTADLVVTTDAADAREIAAVDGVRAAVPVVEVPARVAGDRRPRRTTVTATDPRGYREIMTPRLTSGTTSRFTEGTAIVNGDSESPLARSTRSIRLTIGDREVRLPVVARTGFAVSDFTAAVVPLSQVERGLLARSPSRVMVDVAPGSSADAVRRELVDAGFSEVQTVTAWARGDEQATADANLGVTLGLAGMGGLYALVSVINAVALAAAARKREFAVDRITGMTRVQVVRTSVLETVGVTVIGLVLGALAATVCLLGVRRAFASILGEGVLVFPFGAFGLISLLSLLAVTLTAVTGTWLATRPRPISLAAPRE